VETTTSCLTMWMASLHGRRRFKCRPLLRRTVEQSVLSCTFVVLPSWMHEGVVLFVFLPKLCLVLVRHVLW